MVNSINLIAFGTFGNPNGYRQTFFVGIKDLAGTVKTFDLNTNAIKLFANSKVYAIRKEFVNGSNTIAYSVYTYAREQNSDRSGTFIGSSILYTNKIAKEQITIAQLNEFHSQLVIKNVSNDTISVNHSDKFSVVKPKDFEKIEFHLREIDNVDFKQNTEKSLVVFCNTNDSHLSKLFEKSVDLLNVYDTIYFTDNQEVAEFVYQKGVFKLIQNVGEKRDFDRELNDLIQERKRQREQSISEFEREIQRINDDKSKTIQEFKIKIEESERIHHDNSKKIKESKEDVNKIGQFYDDLLNKTKGLINQLKNSNVYLEEVKQIHNSNKILFNNGVADLKKPIYITTINKPKPNGNIQTERQLHESEYRIGEIRRGEKEGIDHKSYQIDRYKVATLILAFLLVLTWVFFLFSKMKSEDEMKIKDDQQQTGTSSQDHESNHQEEAKIEELNPKYNSKLTENDCRIIAKSLKPNMKLEDVVKIIYSKNPTEISNVYSGQEIIYSKFLLELNKNCFEEKENSFYFIKDTLKVIPSFKQ